MQGAGSKGAPEGRCLLGWTYVARGSALLALPIEPPGKGPGRCDIVARPCPPVRVAGSEAHGTSAFRKTGRT